MKKSRLVIQTVCLYLLIAIAITAFVVHQNNVANAQIKLPVPVVQTVHQTITATPTQPQVISGNPVKLTIPRLNLTLAIVNGTYDSSTQSWSLTNDKAQYATVTAQPNNEHGNTLIYGHDTPSVFYGTKNLVVGDMVYIYTDNGHIFDYAYKGDTNVVPTDTSIFSYDGPPQLTLLTCSGWFSTTRRLMYFNFIKTDQ